MTERRRDDIPSTSSSTQKPKRKSVKNNNLQEEGESKQSLPEKDKIIWTEKELKEYDADKFSFLGETGLPACFDTLESPVDFFSLLFPGDLLDLIVVESNLKSVQDNVNKPANITKNELEQFIESNWILWRRKNEEYIPLIDFKLVVAEHLCKAGKSVSKKKGRPSTLGTPTASRVGSPANADTPTQPKDDVQWEDKIHH
ncbi:hypothetical protein JTB14_017480 [Gonioctena quinquepunctata]|nr:hypothetical protein JTB14_017480 [Gonioctena quinquepunctata]